MIIFIILAIITIIVAEILSEIYIYHRFGLHLWELYFKRELPDVDAPPSASSDGGSEGQEGVSD